VKEFLWIKLARIARLAEALASAAPRTANGKAARALLADKDVQKFLTSGHNIEAMEQQAVEEQGTLEL
jgi:hypothetical protein